MKLNKLVLFALAGSLVSAIMIVSENSGYGFKGEIKAGVFSEVEDEGKDAMGAFESFYSMKVNEATGLLDPAWIQEAIAQADRLKVSSRAAKPITWVEMGPDNIGGRTRAFLMHRDSFHIMFVGSVSGGLFRSNTAGQSWTPVNDKQENLSATCIAQTPDGTIYYGTGEGGFTNLQGSRNGSPAFVGNGVYKSSDNRGTSFSVLPVTKNTSTYAQCNGMVAHPTLNIFWVATETGLFRSDNGGTSFTPVRGGAIRDITIDKDGIVWCANSGGGIFKGNADGTTFTQMNNGIAPGGRTSLAVSPQDPQYVYALGSAGGALSGVWRSTNGGQIWDLIVAKSSVTDIFGANRQGWYDNVVAVDPNNKNHIYLGGVVLAEWDTEKGFREIASTFDAPWNASYVHADNHLIQFDTRTNPATMIIGGDGGLFFSQNRSTWTRRNRGFTSLQLYNVAANYLGHVAGGSQDNGTQLINFTGNSFNGQPSKTGIEIYGGDGFDVEFSRFAPKTIFVSTYYGRVARTANGGQSSSTFWDKRQDGSVPTDFNTTFSLWEKDEKTSMLWLAKNADIWVAINPTDFSADVNWFLVGTSLGNDRIIEMDHTADGDHLFACKPGKLFRFDSLRHATYSTSMYPGSRDIPKPITKVDITPSALTGRTITSVNVSLVNPEHVVVTAGGYGNVNYVYETTNALSSSPTWKNITGNLPSMPVYDAVIDPDDPKRIIIGTELGCWLTENGGTNWEEANTGMARVPVFEIRGYEYNSWEGMVMYLGTHGRGYFKSSSLLTSTKKVKSNENQTAKASPNPANSAVQLTYSASASGKAVVEIFDINGSLVKRLDHQSNFGVNSIHLTIGDFKPGYYFARVAQGASVSTVKFSVAR